MFSTATQVRALHALGLTHKPLYVLQYKKADLGSWGFVQFFGKCEGRKVRKAPAIISVTQRKREVCRPKLLIWTLTDS